MLDPIDLILKEREYQRNKYGTTERDYQINSIGIWEAYISDFNEGRRPRHGSRDFKTRLVKIAALCIAAIQAEKYGKGIMVSDRTVIDHALNLARVINPDETTTQEFIRRCLDLDDIYFLDRLLRILSRCISTLTILGEKMQDSILIECYLRNPHTPEKLAEHPDALSKIGTEYRIETKEWKVTDLQLLARLLDLRKAGKLPNRSDRASKKDKPIEFPSVRELKSDIIGKYYDVTFQLTVQLTATRLTDLIYHAICMGEDKPITRAEVMKLLTQFHTFYPADGTDDYDTEVGAIAEECVKHLFPELL